MSAAKIGELPRFLSQEDLARGKALLEKIDFLRKKKKSVHPVLANRRKKALEAAYVADSSGQALQKLECAAREEQFLRTNLKLYRHAVSDLKKLISSEVKPWVISIAERGLKIAEQNLANVIAQEDSRCKELIGHSVTKSDIIDAARRPVIQMRRPLLNPDDGYYAFFLERLDRFAL